MAFKYVARSAESWEKKTTQVGFSRVGFIREEYRLYTTRKGENAIRILPPTWEGADDYGLRIFVHYGVGPENASVICPKQKPPGHMVAGEYVSFWEYGPCPICEAQQRAREAGNDEESGKLSPRARMLVWLLDVKDERQGVVAWAMPYTVDRDIGKVAKDRMTGEWFPLDDPDRGYTIFFDREDQGQGYPRYTVSQKASSSTRVNPEFVAWCEANPLPKTVILRNYDEINQLYRGQTYVYNGGRGASERRESRETPRETPPPTQHPDPPPWREEERPAPTLVRPSAEPEPEPPPPATPVNGGSKAAHLRERFAALARQRENPSA